MAKKYFSSAGAARHLGLSPSTVATYRARGIFPPPNVIIGEGKAQVFGWSQETLDHWQATRPGKPGRPKGTFKRRP
nr:MAG TPA: Pyocin activator protein PrtN [Caudoviricetes sp.]